MTSEATLGGTVMMAEVLTLSGGILEIVWINILLSGDNAIMIALACQGLPERQRRWGILLGAVGAVALRVGFTLIVAHLLHVPFLKLGGGLFVVYLAAKLPNQMSGPPKVAVKQTLLSAVGSIIVADAVMSLDNALALGAAAKGSQPLIVFGLLLSAPLVFFGARVLASLMERLPLLIWGGAVILGWAGGELIAGDPTWNWLVPTPPSDHWTGAIGCAFVLGTAAVMKFSRTV